MAESTTINVGVNFINGMGAILPAKLHHDMGDHGRLITPIRLKFGSIETKLSYVNKKTGRIIYREIQGNDNRRN